MPTPRECATLSLVDGRFYVIGGDVIEYPRFINMDIIEVYTPVQHPVYAYHYRKNFGHFDESSDSLLITTEFVNHQNHTFSAQAIYHTFDNSFTDSVYLYDDGQHCDEAAQDSLYGNFIYDIDEESHFNLVFKTRNQDTDQDFITLDTVLFSTIGPIVFDQCELTVADTFPQQGDILRFNLTLKNEGSQTTAEIISANVTALDTCAYVMVNYDPTYGDMAPGTYSTTAGYYRIRFYDVSAESINVPFKLDIASNDIVFWSDTFDVKVAPTPTGVICSTDVIPRQFSIRQNYPNPFNPTTKINYEIPITSYVNLSVYNLVGQKVATLVDERQQAGYHQVEWYASGFASGVYYYKIEAGEFQDIKKMILIK